MQWGLAHRKLEGIESIGVDEIHWGKSKRADNFLTVIYQIDSHCRRLLWVGKRRTKATLRRGLAALGEPVVPGLRFVCTDMWRPYLTVIAAKASQALHVLDRFHITSHLNQALDQVAAGGNGTPARGGPDAGGASQKHALEIAAAPQPGARKGPRSTGPTAPHQAGNRARVGAQGPL